VNRWSGSIICCLAASVADDEADLDALHDGGGDMSAYMDTKVRRPHRELQRVNVDFPVPMLAEIDCRAAQRA
jgi:hypothetical protein